MYTKNYFVSMTKCKSLNAKHLALNVNRSTWQVFSLIQIKKTKTKIKKKNRSTETTKVQKLLAPEFPTRNSFLIQHLICFSSSLSHIFSSSQCSLWKYDFVFKKNIVLFSKDKFVFKDCWQWKSETLSWKFLSSFLQLY